MKIAFDAKRALNNLSGLGNYSRNLLNGLTKYFPENEYLLFTPKAKDEFFHQLQGDFKICFPKTQFQKSLHAFWRSFGVTNQVQNARADVYHGLSNEIPLGLKRPGIRTVVTIHDLIFLKHKEQYPFVDRQIYEWKTRYAAKNADRIIAVSNETKIDLMEMYRVDEKNIEIIPPIISQQFLSKSDSISFEQLKRKHRLPAKYILNVGSFFSRKNHSTLIETFDFIKNKVKENLLLVGSSGSEKKKIEQLIENKKLQNRIQIISDVTSEDLPAIYKAASVFVFPSLFEGFGMPITEALLCGVPVVTTKGGCFEEAGGKNSLYVNPNSPEEIANAILRAINNNALRTQMIDGGIIHAQTMSERIHTEKLMRVYSSLC